MHLLRYTLSRDIFVAAEKSGDKPATNCAVTWLFSVLPTRRCRDETFHFISMGCSSTQNAPLQEADMYLKEYQASSGDVEFLKDARSTTRVIK